MKVIEVNGANFEAEVLKSELPVLVDFGATWCPPCQALRPIIEEVAAETDKCKVASIDIDECKDLAMQYEVSSIPCLILFRDGEEVDREIGLKPKKRILKMLEKR